MTLTREELENEEISRYGRVLRAHRLSLKLTQLEVADVIGVAKEMVARWEIGDAWPNRKNSLAIDRFVASFTKVQAEVVKAARKDGRVEYHQRKAIERHAAGHKYTRSAYQKLADARAMAFAVDGVVVSLREFRLRKRARCAGTTR